MKFRLAFPEEIATSIKVIVLRKLQDKLATLNVPVPLPCDLKTKIEIKICLDFVKALLGNTDIVCKVFIDNDFTSIRRPVVTGLLNTCVKVLTF